MRIELPNEISAPNALTELLGADCVAYGTPPARITGIATHSLEVRRGDLFVCLEGTSHDGSAFVDAALSIGAGAILSRTPPCTERTDFWFLQAEDTRKALLRAAGGYRARVGARVIAVTGSTGKTTVKDAIAEMLGNVPHSKGNFNSITGMPLSVLSMPRAQAWVLELGINQTGEMRAMAQSLMPDIALITNVGSAHIGNFGDFSTILAEKMQIAHALSAKGTLILPSELPMPLLQLPNCRVVRVGVAHGADAVVENVQTSHLGTRCDLRYGDRYVKDLFWPIPGRIGVSVLGLVGSVGLQMGCTEEEIREGIKRASLHTPRLRQIRVGDLLFLDDTYNASPESVITSLEVLKAIACHRPAIAVLGDMCELGAYSASLHDAVGVFAARLGISALYTYGDEAVSIATGAMRVGMAHEAVHCYGAQKKEQIVRDLCQNVPHDAVILFKASRKTALDGILEAVRRSL